MHPANTITQRLSMRLVVLSPQGLPCPIRHLPVVAAACSHRSTQLRMQLACRGAYRASVTTLYGGHSNSSWHQQDWANWLQTQAFDTGQP